MVIANFRRVAGNAVLSTTTGLATDADETQTIDTLDDNNLGMLPKTFSMQVVRTAGSTNAVDVALQASLDGSNFADITGMTVTDVSSVANGIKHFTTDFTSAAGERIPIFRHFKGLVTTVGSGNTLSMDFIVLF